MQALPRLSLIGPPHSRSPLHHTLTSQGPGLSGAGGVRGKWGADIRSGVSPCGQLCAWGLISTCLFQPPPPPGTPQDQCQLSWDQVSQKRPQRALGAASRCPRRGGGEGTRDSRWRLSSGRRRSADTTGPPQAHLGRRPTAKAPDVAGGCRWASNFSQPTFSHQLFSRATALTI